MLKKLNFHENAKSKSSVFQAEVQQVLYNSLHDVLHPPYTNTRYKTYYQLQHQPVTRVCVCMYVSCSTEKLQHFRSTNENDKKAPKQWQNGWRGARGSGGESKWKQKT